jgi:hypothetical protein
MSQFKIGTYHHRWAGLELASRYAVPWLAAAGVLLILVFGYWWSRTVAPVSVIRTHLMAVEEGEYWRAYDMLASSAKEAMPFAEFVSLLQQNSVVMEPRDNTFLFRRVQGDTAAVRGTVVGYAGKATDVKYNLVREQGQWKIASFSMTPPH